VTKVAPGKAIVDLQIAAFDPAEPPEFLLQCGRILRVIRQEQRPDEAPPARLLRPR
jgi:hypothetical protein